MERTDGRTEYFVNRIELGVAVGTIDYGAATTPRRSTGGLARASFVCGCLLFIPILAGLVAIALGLPVLFLSAYRGHGRRWAIAGTLLGMLNVMGWSVLLYLFISSMNID